jgi:putative hydrolase of the HAD superfamily
MTPDSPSIEVLLFDLGGVLVHWNGIEPIIRLSRQDLEPEDVRRFWLESPSVRQFERGRCSPEEFAVGMIAELELDIAPEVLLVEFLDWDHGPFPEALELLDELKPRFRLACLSNNNELHWRKIRDRYDFGSRFHHAYLSQEIGEMKPDRAAFEHVIRELDVAAETIIFFDDNPECIATALALGLRAHQVRGVYEVRQVLRDLGIRTGGR